MNFTKSDASSIVIDFGDSEQTELSGYYRGGFIFDKNQNVSLLAENSNVLELTNFYPQDFQGEGTDEMSILGALKNSNFKNFKLLFSGTNLYKVHNIKGFLEKCYDSSITLKSVRYNAYDALPGDANVNNEKHMFDDSNTIFSESPTLNAKAAAAILTGGKTNILANVRVTPYEGSDAFEKPKTADGKIVNVQFDTDMSSITGGNLKAYGVVKFDNLPPRALNSDQDAKVILNKKLDGLNKETFKVDTLDVSTIPAPYNTQDDMKYFNSISNVLFVSETFVSMDRQPSTTIYIGDKYFKAQISGITHTNYTNISREKYAYEAVIKSNTNENILKRSNEDLVKLDDNATSIPATSRANNIKLTPMQKLLIDDQHIYG